MYVFVTFWHAYLPFCRVSSICLALQPLIPQGICYMSVVQTLMWVSSGCGLGIFRVYLGFHDVSKPYFKRSQNSSSPFYLCLHQKPCLLCAISTAAGRDGERFSVFYADRRLCYADGFSLAPLFAKDLHVCARADLVLHWHAGVRAADSGRRSRSSIELASIISDSEHVTIVWKDDVW